MLMIMEFVKMPTGLKGVAIRTPGGRAQPSGVRSMQLDISKINRYGSKPTWSSDVAVRLAVQQLVQQLQIK